VGCKLDNLCKTVGIAIGTGCLIAIVVGVSPVTIPAITTTVVAPPVIGLVVVHHDERSAEGLMVVP